MFSKEAVEIGGRLEGGGPSHQEVKCSAEGNEISLK